MSCELYKGISRPIDSFVKYFLDIKPYHTKILEILEKYRFNEDVDVTILENMHQNIIMANAPLCKQTGWGVDWDDDCGFDALNCCDLFDCIGGYGLIFDNSDLLVDAPILSTDTELGNLVVQGNRTYDTRVQIKSISSPTVFTVQGDWTALFNTHGVFLIVPKHTYQILSILPDGFVIAQNHASEFYQRGNFLVYASSGNDKNYNVKSAAYDFSTNTTIIKTVESINNVNGSGMIEIKSGNKNNGIYQSVSATFNGTDTIVTLKSSTKIFTILNETSFGSVQFRTGFTAPRYLALSARQSGIDFNNVNNDYRILQSVYDYGSDTTVITFTRKLIQNYNGGRARLYGYLFQAGYDGDAECSAPKPMNVHNVFSEYLKITIKSSSTTPPLPG